MIFKVVVIFFTGEICVVLKRFSILYLLISVSVLLSSCDTTLKWKDFRGGTHLSIEVTSTGDATQSDHNIDKIINVMQKRLRKFDVNKAILQKQGENIIVQLAYEEQLERIIGLITRPAVIEFKLVDEKYESPKYENKRLPAIYEKRFMVGTNQPLIVRKKTLLNNQMLSEIKSQYDSFEDEPYLALKFTNKGAELFKEITSDNINKRLAILIDGKIYTAPVIQSAIPGGRAMITGDFSNEEVLDFELMFKYGSYPSTVKIMEKKKLNKALWLGDKPSQHLIIIQKDNVIIKMCKMFMRKLMYLEE